MLLACLSSCYVKASIKSLQSTTNSSTSPNPTPAPTPAPSTNYYVSKYYPNNGSKWLYQIKNNNGGTNYFDQPDTACTGAETGMHACFQGADKLYYVEDSLSNCNQVKAEDALGALEWWCAVVNSKVVLRSSGLKIGKGLNDLIDFSTLKWKNNNLIIYKNSSIYKTTTSEAWWNTTDNPIVALPSSTASTITLNGFAPGTILVAANSANSKGYVIDQDRIALVTATSATLTYSGTSINVNETTGKATSPDIQALLAVGSQKFTWIEGNFGDSSSHLINSIIFLRSAKFNRLNKFKVLQGSHIDNTISIFSGSEQNIFSDVQVQNVGDTWWGLYLEADYNDFYNLKIHNHSYYTGTFYALAYLQGNYNVFDYFSVNTSAYTGVDLAAFSNNFVNHFISYGTNSIKMGDNGTVSSNTFSHWTILSPNTNYCILETANIVFSNTFNQIHCINGLVYAQNSGLNTYSQVTTSMPNYNNQWNLPSNTYMKNNLIFYNGISDTCKVDAVNTNCSNVNSQWTASWTSWIYNFVNSLKGIIYIHSDLSNTSIDINSSDAYSTLTAITDFINFDNFYRMWGSAASAGRCLSSSSCSIWDLRISSSDGIINNHSISGFSTNPSFTGLAACPTGIDGSHYLDNMQSTPVRFIYNASEIINDGLGNENGLCESGEACIYSPNFGAYQGEGDYKTNGACIFTNGSITNVIMYGYPTIGI